MFSPPESHWAEDIIEAWEDGLSSVIDQSTTKPLEVEFFYYREPCEFTMQDANKGKVIAKL